MSALVVTLDTELLLHFVKRQPFAWVDGLVGVVTHSAIYTPPRLSAQHGDHLRARTVWIRALVRFIPLLDGLNP